MAALSSIFQKLITSKARLVLTACPIIFFGATKTRVKPRREVCISKDDDDDDDDDDGIIIETPRAGRKYLKKKTLEMKGSRARSSDFYIYRGEYLIGLNKERILFFFF